MKSADLAAYLDDCLQLWAFQGAVATGAQLLVVHHGLFWSNPIQITGVPTGL
jgi:putative NIF3 family GTP cyclohydrolase 1 type 2